jgi:hypothetical protein
MSKSLAPIAASAVLVLSSTVASLAAEGPPSFLTGNVAARTNGTDRVGRSRAGIRCRLAHAEGLESIEVGHRRSRLLLKGMGIGAGAAAVAEGESGAVDCRRASRRTRDRMRFVSRDFARLCSVVAPTMATIASST